MVLTEKLSDLAELDAASIELLEAVGVDRVTTLARSSGEHLQVEMSRANRMLRIRADDPDALEIARWIGAAREQAGERAEGLSFARAVSASSNVSPQETQPIYEAIPVSPQRMIEGGISVEDVAIMDRFFSDEELSTPVSTAVQVQEQPAPEVIKPEPRMNGTGADKFSVTTKEKKPFSLPTADPVVEEQTETEAGIQPLQGKGRSLMTAPLPETNAGKKEHSRSYIRGVLHPQPFRVYLGAFIAIITITLLPLSFVAMVMIVMKQSIWWLAVPGAAIIFGILYAMFATYPRCRICGQPIFVPKRCRRHVKAHHIPLVGYILPTGLQLIFFKWFRCIFCGTSVRLKE